MVGGAEPSKPLKIQVPDIAHGAVGFGVCPTGFGSCFASVFPHCAPIPLVVHRNVCSMTLYDGSM